jgi:hypothetical protein
LILLAVGPNFVWNYSGQDAFPVPYWCVITHTNTKRVEIALTLHRVECETKLAWCSAGFVVFLGVFKQIPNYLAQVRQDLFFSKGYPSSVIIFYSVLHFETGILLVNILNNQLSKPELF